MKARFLICLIITGLSQIAFAEETSCDLSIEYFAGVTCNYLQKKINNCPQNSRLEVKDSHAALEEFYPILRQKGYRIVEPGNSNVKLHFLMELHLGYLSRRGTATVNLYKNNIRHYQHSESAATYSPFRSKVALSASSDPASFFQNVPSCSELSKLAD